MQGLKSVSLYCLIFTLCFFKSHAQNSFLKTSSFGGQFHYGSFITNEPKAVYVRDSYSYFGELYFQRPTVYASKPNRTPPHWGAGLFLGHTGSKKYIGKMAGAFTFIRLPLLKYRTFTSSLRLSAGLGWIEKPYDKITNHKNVLIGTAINAYLNGLWQNEWKLTSKLSLNAGLSFSHLSNGSSTLPNLGLNIPALSLGFSYAPISRPTERIDIKTPSAKKWSWQTFTSIGIKQTPWIESKHYLINVLSTEITRRISTRSQLGIGAFTSYDRSAEIDPSIEPFVGESTDKLQAGIYTAYAFNVGRLTMPIQIGIPLVNNKVNGSLFEQLGVRYNITKQWSGQVLLKTYGGKADVIHFGVGYQIL